MLLRKYYVAFDRRRGRVGFARAAAAEPAASAEPSGASAPEAAPLELIRSKRATGYLGVSHDARSANRPYLATLRIGGGKQLHLGNFASAKDAATAYALAVRRASEPHGCAVALERTSRAASASRCARSLRIAASLEITVYLLLDPLDHPHPTSNPYSPTSSYTHTSSRKLRFRTRISDRVSSTRNARVSSCAHRECDAQAA